MENFSKPHHIFIYIAHVIENVNQTEKKMNKSDWSGLDKLQRKLKKLDGTHSVSFDELFNASFMNKYTQHSTIVEFFDEGGFEFETEEEFEKISEEEVDKHVQNVTNFATWREMLNKAGENWVAKELGF